MRCGQCGEQVPDKAHFCGLCGAKIEVAAAEPVPLIGRTIAGRYRLVRMVGEGGMGSVYEAEQALGSSQRSVAVKLLRPEWSHDPAVQARFHREAATVARLEHFNTVRVYDFGTTEDGALYIVMEYLQGQSLQKVLEQHGALAPARVEHIASQVAASLEEAHGLGIVHRDLKPDNILLIDSYASQRDVVKIVDFGIAKAQAALGASTTKLTEFGALVGTPAYMSPEQFTTNGVGPSSDIYSLGITTYQMLSGRLPFDADTAVEWAQSHTSKSPLPLAADYGAGPIPDAMRRAVERALAKDPEQRPASAIQFAKELSGAVAVGVIEPRAAGDAANLAAGEGAAASGSVPKAGGPPKTAPMLELPDARGSSGRPVPTTQPMAVVQGARDAGFADRAGAAAYAAPPQYVPEGRGWGALLWVTLGLVLSSGLALLFFALDGPRYLPWNSGEPEAPPPLGSALSPPGAAVPAPAAPEPAPAPEPAAPEPERPSSPARTSTPSRPSRPAPLPPPPAAVPSAPAAPGVPTAPGSPTTPPPAPGAAGQPSTQPPAPGLPAPTLPWNLPTAGSCERCMAALAGPGHYTIVQAVAERLLCEDRVARDTCERKIVEIAPAVAEQAGREGDCTAALATAAAAVNVGVSPDRFSNVNALCLH
jgi:eukaryotic-like serine/threonine-protein kinase